MPVNLKGRSFLTLKDFTPDEIRYMLNLAADLKAKKRAGIRGNLLAGKNIVLLFEKTSTRTRCAFEVAAYDEGAHVTFLDSKSSQMGKKETMVDTAKVLAFTSLSMIPALVFFSLFERRIVGGLAAHQQLGEKLRGQAAARQQLAEHAGGDLAAAAAAVGQRGEAGRGVGSSGGHGSGKRKTT